MIPEQETSTRKRPVSMMVKLSKPTIRPSTESLNVSQSSYASIASTINSSVKISINQSSDPIVVAGDQPLTLRENSITRKTIIRPSRILNKTSNQEAAPKKRITFSVDSKPAMNFLKVPKMDGPLETKINNLIKVLGEGSPTKKGNANLCEKSAFI